jgi:hypothetical protein
MHLASSTAVFALSLLASAAAAQDSFDCKQIGNGEYRVYQGLGDPKPQTPIGPVKIKKGAIIAYEDRPLLTEWYKPEGGVGGVIAYKQPQIAFSHYLVDGQEKFCSSQRHSDVFGAEEMVQQYYLRCLSDSDQDGKYDTFHRYGELVSYDFRTGKTGAATGAVQTDQSLILPFKLVSLENVTSQSRYAEKVLRSMIDISELSKGSVTLRVASQATNKGFDEGKPTQFERSPSTEVVLPLIDGSVAMLDGTKVRVNRASSRWAISLPEGFATDARMICSGIALETPQSVSVFGGSSMYVLSRKALAQ